MHNQIKVITNNVPRFIEYGYELPINQRAEFDYMGDDEFMVAQFFKYKGQYYDLGEFTVFDHNKECLPSAFKEWHGHISDSFFSGVLVKIVSDESVIIGIYIS